MRFGCKTICYFQGKLNLYSGKVSFHMLSLNYQWYLLTENWRLCTHHWYMYSKLHTLAQLLPGLGHEGKRAGEN